MEQSFEERARVSAPGMRTFANIARRWQLTDRQQAHLLGCDTATLRQWAATAQQHKSLVLETSTLMRLSVMLGVFADLRQFLAAASGAREERRWLLYPRQFPPFNGRAPLEVLSGDFEEQMTVRRHLAAVAATFNPEAYPPASIDEDVPDPRRPGDIIRGICFDAFGTLVEITDKRRPFQALLAREPSASRAVRVMTHPIGLRELAQSLSMPIAEERLVELEGDLNAEVSSMRVRAGMDRAWSAVRRAGLRIGVCSNLAEPYEKPLLQCLPGKPDALVLSFRSKLMKPQAEIYLLACSQLGLKPSEVLFVGDALYADVIGPSTINAFSMPVSEFERSLSGASFYAPHPITQLFERIFAASTT